MSDKENKPKFRHIVLTVIGIVLCVILLPILIVNVTLIIKGATNKDDVPMIGGYFPMIVLSDSMAGVFDGGDLTINKTINAEEVKLEDIIVFYDPDSNGSSTVTHRVKEIIDDGDGTISFKTKGDANDTYDSIVPEEKLIGIYCFHLDKMGNVAMFMQSTAGLIVCVLIPLVALVVYEVIRRSMDKKSSREQEDLKAELESLKAEKARLESDAYNNSIDEVDSQQNQNPETNELIDRDSDADSDGEADSSDNSAGE